jgi:two-component system, cell cycle response regulator
MRILIAEDDGVSRLVLRQAVQKLGHECLAAADGLEAWDLFRRTDCDVVISDWMMPGLDGIELCRRVREDPRVAYPYFILLTALGEKKDILTGLQAGADDYLTKPLDRDEIQVRLIAAARVTSLYRQLAVQRGELERLNRDLFSLARQDSLTHLGNRLRLREDLEALSGEGGQPDHPWCVALCDVDFFKEYNDTHGHLAGDDVLCAVGMAIARACRNGDRAYRYGGEEFLLLLREQSLETATAAVERLRRAVEILAIPHTGRACQGKVTISAGIATLVPGEDSTDDVLREADAALYRAKAAGRNRVAVSDRQIPGRRCAT